MEPISAGIEQAGLVNRLVDLVRATRERTGLLGPVGAGAEFVESGPRPNQYRSVPYLCDPCRGPPSLPPNSTLVHVHTFKGSVEKSMAARLAAITRHVRLTAIALLVAPALTAGVPSAIGSGVLTASASGCNVTPGIYSRYSYTYNEAYVRMTATWGPSCPWQHNTLAVYEQIGYNDYYDLYGETLPPTNHGSAD